MKIIVEEYSFEPSASINELKEFKNSHIWRDFVKYIEFKLEGNVSILENSPEHKEILKSQGIVLVAKDILGLPDQMIEWINEDRELDQE
jgi:hypothetical protein